MNSKYFISMKAKIILFVIIALIFGNCSDQNESHNQNTIETSKDHNLHNHDDIKTHEGDSVHGAFLISFLDDKSECLLIKNRGTNSFFYKKYRKLDYFLCPMDEEEINPKIIRIVKGFKDISVCFVLDKPNQKDILNFAQLQ